MKFFSGQVQSDQAYWLARVPLICFWIVAWHYPERVMRQFGLFQSVPPPNPHSWTDLQALNKIGHYPKTSTNWSIKHAPYIGMWDHPHIINETRPYDESTYREYRRWYQRRVYPQFSFGDRYLFFFLYEI